MNPALTSRTGELASLVREGNLATVVDRAHQLPPADLADLIVALPANDATALIDRLPVRLLSSALWQQQGAAQRAALISALGHARSATILGERPRDDAASFLAPIDTALRRAVARQLGHSSGDFTASVFPINSAGALMTKACITTNELDSVDLAIEGVRRQAAAAGEVSEIYVLDVERRLRGVLPIQELLIGSSGQIVRDLMSADPIHVGPESDGESVAHVIARYNLSSVAVVGRDGKFLGRVTASSARRVDVSGAADDLMRFGGVSTREPLEANAYAAVRSRMPSLYANVVAAMGAAAVVFLFRSSIVRSVSLAVWLPVVASVSGIAGTQALAASVRRLVLHPEGAAGIRRVIRREALTGTMNGLGIGAVSGGVAVLIGESWKFGAVVALAMAGNLALSATAAAVWPVAMRRLGRDPLAASPAVLMAIADITGFALLLALAHAVLR